MCSIKVYREVVMAPFWQLLLVLSSLELVSVVRGACSDRATCGDCISDSGCFWCAQISNSTHFQRCRNANEGLGGCHANFTINPKSSAQALLNEQFNTSSGEIDQIQLKPQKIFAKLRVGDSKKINITLRKLIDYPLDLYYLMDLSLSMQDDLIQLKQLGRTLVDGIKSNVTDNVQVGFGSFVDKVIIPFATDDRAWLNANCGNLTCEPTFGFHHQLAITPDSARFQNTVQSTIISSNIDRPEGGFDALMQIAVCQDTIKWRKESLRVVLLTTDALPHHAMDGALIGLLKKNDMQCHLAKISPTSDVYYYSETVKQDYPSVGQLREVFAQHKIQTIFAVTQTVYRIYKELQEVLPDAFVEILEGDSSNIQSVVEDAYNAIKSRFSLVTPTAPPMVDMSYRVLCPGASIWAENSLQCNNVYISDEVVFQFELKAKECPTNKTQRDMISIAANIIPDVVNIDIEYECECACNSEPEENSPHCGNEHGSLKCGVCDCTEGRSGFACECETTLSYSELIQQCTDTKRLETDGAGAMSVCHGRGTCDCGKCNCRPGFSGKYCECSDAGCAVSVDGSMCGGSLRGQCNRCYDNQTCICNSTAGWYHNQAGLCLCNDDLCKAEPTDGQLCSGRGECNCHTCNCTSSTIWTGTHCNTCIHPSCNNITGTCDGADLRQCALCVYGSQGTAACQPFCQALGVNFRRSAALPDCSSCLPSSREVLCAECKKFNEDVFATIQCSTQDISSCNVNYTIAWHSDYQNYFLYVKQRDVQKDCPQPIDPVLIVVPTVGAIVGIGVIALIAWKVLRELYFKRQWKHFQLELKKREWIKEDNPLHVAPTTKVMNPKFVSKNDDEIPGGQQGLFHNDTYENMDE